MKKKDWIPQFTHKIKFSLCWSMLIVLPFSRSALADLD